jgi:hypothetical protein
MYEDCRLPYVVNYRELCVENWRDGLPVHTEDPRRGGKHPLLVTGVQV